MPLSPGIRFQERGLRTAPGTVNLEVLRLRALLYTGGRLGEVTGLTWRDVDLAAGRVVIPMPKLHGKTKTLTVSRALRSVLEARPRGLLGFPVFLHPDGRAWKGPEIQTGFVVLARLRPGHLAGAVELVEAVENGGTAPLHAKATEIPGR
jgi:integrase